MHIHVFAGDVTLDDVKKIQAAIPGLAVRLYEGEKPASGTGCLAVFGPGHKDVDAIIMQCVAAEVPTTVESPPAAEATSDNLDEL